MCYYTFAGNSDSEILGKERRITEDQADAQKSHAAGVAQQKEVKSKIKKHGKVEDRASVQEPNREPKRWRRRSRRLRLPLGQANSGSRLEVKKFPS